MGAKGANKSPTEPTQNSHSAGQKQNTKNTADLMTIIAARKQPLQKSERGAETKEGMRRTELRGAEGPGGRGREAQMHPSLGRQAGRPSSNVPSINQLPVAGDLYINIYMSGSGCHHNSHVLPHFSFLS